MIARLRRLVDAHLARVADAEVATARRLWSR